MSERVKSFLLTALVLSSLFLTYRLWFGPKPLEELTDDAYEPIPFEETRSLNQVVAPRSIDLQHDGMFYRFEYGSQSYQLLWDWVSGLLQRTPYTGYSLMEEKPGKGSPLLICSFQPPLPVGQGSPWLKDGAQRKLEEVVVMKEGDQYWLEIKATGVAVLRHDVLSGLDLSLQELIASLNLDVALQYRELNAADLVASLGMDIKLVEPMLVPAEPVPVQDLLFTAEEQDRELLARIFFVDRSLVRVITERDGSVIYTDGERGLRFSSGFVFSHPQIEMMPATHTYIASLYSASRFLSYYGGWPEQLRLSYIGRGEAGYLRGSIVASWRYYYQGRPIIGDVGAVMVFNDSGLVEYKRKLLSNIYPAEASFVAGNFHEAIASAMEVIQSETDSTEAQAPFVLEEIELGYSAVQAPADYRLIPVWVIRINGLELLINAKDMSWLEGVQP